MTVQGMACQPSEVCIQRTVRWNGTSGSLLSGHAKKPDGAMHCRMSLVVTDGSSEGL